MVSFLSGLLNFPSMSWVWQNSWAFCCWKRGRLALRIWPGHLACFLSLPVTLPWSIHGDKHAVLTGSLLKACTVPTCAWDLWGREKFSSWKPKRSKGVQTGRPKELLFLRTKSSSVRQDTRKHSSQAVWESMARSKPPTPTPSPRQQPQLGAWNSADNWQIHLEAKGWRLCGWQLAMPVCQTGEIKLTRLQSCIVCHECCGPRNRLLSNFIIVWASCHIFNKPSWKKHYKASKHFPLATSFHPKKVLCNCRYISI